MTTWRIPVTAMCAPDRPPVPRDRQTLAQRRLGIHYQSPSYIQISAHENNKHLDNYRTDQFVIGPEWLPRPDTRVTLEAYTKRYRDVPVATSWTTPDPWDSSNGELVNAAKGHSEGVELYLHRKMSTSYMYILSYSFYRAWFRGPPHERRKSMGFRPP